MECRVNIWTAMECDADAKYAAQKIDEKMKTAWTEKKPYSFWGVEFDNENGWIEAYKHGCTMTANTTRDVTADDAITLYVYFAHMLNAKKFEMEVVNNECSYYAIFRKCRNKLIMEYLPRTHFPPEAIEDDDFDLEVLMGCLDRYKVTKVLATDDGYTIRRAV